MAERLTTLVGRPCSGPARALLICAGRKKNPSRGSGEVLCHPRRPFFNTERGFGFILPDEGGPDVFVHVHDLEAAGIKTSIEVGRRPHALSGVHGSAIARLPT